MSRAEWRLESSTVIWPLPSPVSKEKIYGEVFEKDGTAGALLPGALHRAGKYRVCESAGGMTYANEAGAGPAPLRGGVVTLKRGKLRLVELSVRGRGGMATAAGSSIRKGAL